MVMKVRARSSAALRALAFGAARTPAGAAVCEMVVMSAPPSCFAAMCRREANSARGSLSPGWRRVARIQPELAPAAPGPECRNQFQPPKLARRLLLFALENDRVTAEMGPDLLRDLDHRRYPRIHRHFGGVR